MASDPETREHQLDMLRKRIEAAKQAKREAWSRQDHRDTEKRQVLQIRENNLSIERQDQRQHSKEMYDQRRSDQLIDNEISAVGSLEAEQEKTSRELMLIKLGAEIYSRRLDEDFQDYVQRSNIDLQGYLVRSKIDTSAELEIIQESSSEARREIREHLRSLVIEKVTGHIVAMREKKADGEIEQERMILENELKKDFELFMFELRHKAQDMSDEAIAESLARMKTNSDKYQI